MKPILTAAAACLLAACAAAPETQYFQLPDSRFRLPAGAGKSEVAVRVHLAETLKQPGLVYQIDEGRLNFARRHLWAEPLDTALSARFANELNRLGTRYRYLPARHAPAAQTLDIYIEAFNGSYQGYTLVQGYSRWADGSGRNFARQTAQQGDGYAAMLQSLSEGITAAAQDIAR
ncbi:membrane integrity-associated transporter subunit PqiC [Neisseria leonii]|uniref:PqiC family protein n=1 Tax=Neisseria leonii TaxID=2995413 RepID=UPI00237BC6FC|nr:ABC-type transport auxiliary lipoprotein family protein [Neisseria sp. 3986]MDD9324790.1 ABC-type transport auxiliary lipoprotein family protein [Neisseria sp. 3986]